MRTFEIKSPDGRLIRHLHESLDDARQKVVPGYEIVGEVIGASSDGTGGLVNLIGGKSVLTLLLEAHGDDLRAWLADNYKLDRRAKA